MTKMNKELKEQTSGGIGPMMLWVIIMGVVMAVDTICNIASANSTTDDQSYGSNNKTGSSYSTSKRSTGYLRMSPFPARSAIMMSI